MQKNPYNPFGIQGVLQQHYGTVGKITAPAIEKITGLNQLAKDYTLLPPTCDQSEFIQNVFDLYQINIDTPHNNLNNIPRTGPTIIVSNHPYGAIEGLALAKLILSVRQDLKIIANYHLSRIPEIKDLFLSVDPFEGAKAKQRNIRPMREAIRWLENDGVVLAFPAGEVSHWHFKDFKVADPVWSTNVARIVNKTQASVVPVYIHGHNSVPFQILGLLHPRIRTLMLAHEFLNRKEKAIKISIAEPIRYEQLTRYATNDELTHYIRQQTYNVQYPLASMNHPIAKAKNAQELAEELANLNDSELLCSNNTYNVYCAKANSIPNTLYEIGRLREISFRATGEGTGKSIDLDIYDNYYYHLFIWHKDKQEIIGAYRLGLTDEILNTYGKKGLYTHSLFKYKNNLLHQLRSSIELGRSFVRLEYQREYTPLMLLWKGIGTFIANNPSYSKLFGPVSISNEYSSMSRQMMVEFLKHNNYDANLSKLVKPRAPFKQRRFKDQLTGMEYTSSLEALSNAITQVELDNKGVPILIKQYLKLGGKILGFNIDKDFSNALDALIMVDLCNTETKVLKRYMSKDGLEKFFAYHQSKAA